MIAKWQNWRALVQTMVLIAAVVAGPGLGLAQFQDDLGDQDFFGEEDQFMESDDAFGIGEEDFTEGGEFIDESTLSPGEQGITAGARQSELRTLGEREKLPMNAAWGAGTGLLIGGWFALINAGTNRETQRAMGLGVVAGTLIGITVGVKTLIAPGAPIPVGRYSPPPAWGNGGLQAAVTSATPFQFTFSVRF